MGGSVIGITGGCREFRSVKAACLGDLVEELVEQGAIRVLLKIAGGRRCAPGEEIACNGLAPWIDFSEEIGRGHGGV